MRELARPGRLAGGEDYRLGQIIGLAVRSHGLGRFTLGLKTQALVGPTVDQPGDGRRERGEGERFQRAGGGDDRRDQWCQSDEDQRPDRKIAR